MSTISERRRMLLATWPAPWHVLEDREYGVQVEAADGYGVAHGFASQELAQEVARLPELLAIAALAETRNRSVTVDDASSDGTSASVTVQRDDSGVVHVLDMRVSPGTEKSDDDDGDDGLLTSEQLDRIRADYRDPIDFNFTDEHKASIEANWTETLEGNVAALLAHADAQAAQIARLEAACARKDNLIREVVKFASEQLGYEDANEEEHNLHEKALAEVGKR